MADPDLKVPTELEKEITELMRALEERPQDVDKFAKLMRFADRYVQNTDVAQPEESQFRPHQLCARCYTNRRLDDPDVGKEKELRFRLQVCMLRSLSFKLNRLIRIWLKGLYSTLSECVDCYKGFLRAKRELGPLFLHTFEEGRIEHFLIFAEEWEETNALALIDERDLSEGVEKPVSSSELYALLALAGALAARGKRDGLYKLLKSKRAKLRLVGLEETPSGLLAFAVDEEENTRSWAEMQTTVPPMSREICVTKTMQMLLSYGIQRKEWNGVRSCLKMAPDSLKGSALPNTLVAHLSDSSHSVAVFQFFKQVLEIRGWRLWEGEDAEYPLVVLATLLDDPNYRECLRQPEAVSDYVLWMQPFLQSLLPPPTSANDAVSIEAGGSSWRPFEDGFKRLVYFLVETLQLGQVGIAWREAAFTQAVALLMQHLQQSDDHQAVAEEECSRIAAEVISLHASLLANFALRGKIPNTLETVALDSDARRSTLELIQTVFEMDCDHLSTCLLHLSNAAIDHQTSFKKLYKQRGEREDRSPASQDSSLMREADELFSSAAKTLDMPPWISSDLWRESYNAFRPNDDVGLFLKPLARLSTFVQPQINSHIVAVRGRFLDRPAFSTYKERLKACLLSLTRRLRSMRGNLPQLLLDVADENGSQASASHVLSTMCYTLANHIIEANLCPEPDIYKAAQNIVRSTFEEAETRGDCFRALIQCNAALAFEGMESYLESFVVAASTLVEANDAAKWMVRSFSDILDVLCSQTDGLLRVGTPHSLLDNTSASAHVRRRLPPIWQLMCRSIAIIFKRTPSWSRVLPHTELTAWFRDVLLFASELVDQVSTVQAAAIHGGQDEQHVKAGILTDMAIPLEEASSWFRMNDINIVAETRDYFVKGLLCFKGDVKLPASVKERMLVFIDGQSRIEDSNARMTLLSLRELSDLRHLLEPRTVIEIGDSEEDEDDDDQVLTIRTPPPPADRPQPLQGKPFDQRGDGVEAPPSTKTERQRKFKQQKLPFQTSNPAASRPFVSKPAPPKPPAPKFAAPVYGSNRYQSATTTTARSASSGQTSRSSSNAFAEVRRNFNAASPWKQLHSNFSRPGYIRSARELPDPEAPGAKRSFPGAAALVVHGQTKQKPAEESESSESESENEKETMGLADLVNQSKSPIKMRPKPKMLQKPPPRRTVLMEDLEAKRRQREREEVERKRKLRERANFSSLHRSILLWNFYADSPRPPSPPKSLPLRYEAVKATYKDPEDYMGVFDPMILLECWAELTGAREQIGRGASENPCYTITVSARSAVDCFITITATMGAQASKLPRPFQETDIVYIREAMAVSNSRPKAILAKVDAFKFHGMGHRLTLKCCLEADAQGMSSLLVAGSTLEMGLLFSLTTIHREYEALRVMQYYDLLPSILQAKCSTRETVSEREIALASEDYGVNRPQAEAILGSLKAEQGFNLIQGPPGTGKTKTICSLIACFVQMRKPPVVAIRAGQVGAGTGIKRKILLCAPSNAAVDEVAKRVFEGVKLASGKTVKPSIVRLGREDSLNVSVKPFSLDRLVEKKLTASSASGSQPGASGDPAKILADIRALKDERDAKRAELENARLSGSSPKVIAQLDAEMRAVLVRRMSLMSKLDEVKDRKQTADRQQTADRKRAEQEVLAEADVICATLGGAGHNMLAELNFDFETVVIDEASQAVELDTLIPLRYGCQRCILVGDPNQLPPTVISQEAEMLDYSKSLFVRLFNNPNNVTYLLSIQYRMHPSISRFPSMEFYQGKLTDGPEMAALTAKPWHRDTYLAPFRFFHCQRSQELSRGTSMFNREEAIMAVAIYERLRKEAARFGAGSIDAKVGVVTMYKQQVYELKLAFRAAYGAGIEDVVDFNTVDGFQGQEKDVVILSCVRSHGLGFLNDFRRVNVAITRAKSNLFIVGNVGNLEKSGPATGIWPKFVAMARKENSLMVVTSEMFKRPSFTAPALAHSPSGKMVAPSPAASPRPIAAPASATGTPTSKQSPAKRKAAGTSPTGPRASKRANIDPRRPPLPYNLPNRAPPSDTRSPHPPQVRGPSSRPPQAQQPVQARRPATRPPLIGARSTARPRQPSATSKPDAGVPVLPPGPVANAPRAPPRPAQLQRPRPTISSQEGPSDRARSSLFISKPLRAARPRRGR